jgi:hypothetical protein
MWMRIFTLSFLLLLSKSNQAIALEDINIHGSLSQSFLKTTKNDFLFSGTNKGSFEFTEAVLNTSKAVSNKLLIGAQLLSRNFGDEGNFKTALDWGYGDYQFNSKIGLRAGKVRLPLGFYNEYRDIDSAQTEIFRQQGPYYEPMRAFLLSYSGFGVYGNVFSNSKLGNVDYHLYYGTLDIPSDFSLLRFVNAGLNTTGGLDTERIFGGQILWNTPAEGLRFGYSFLDYKGAFDTTSPALIFSQALTNFSVQEGLLFDAQQNIVGVEYQNGPWTFSAEHQLFLLDADFSQTFKNNFITGLSNSTSKAIANAAYAQTLSSISGLSSDQSSWYLSLTYQYNDKLSQFLSYGHMIGNRDNNSAVNNYRKDIGLGLRYDVSANWRVKFEAHSFSGSENAIQATNRNSIADKWALFAARVSFDF